MTKVVTMTGLEMIKCSSFDSLTFLAAAAQISDVITEEEHQQDDEIDKIMTDQQP